jgi:TRAP-type C4-dicarboxylate transport system permease small subunit
MNLAALLDTMDRYLDRLMRYAVMGVLCVILLLLTYGMIIRHLPSLAVAGYEEIIELLFVWMIFVGAAILWREGSLFRVEFVDGLPAPVSRAFKFVTQGLMLCFALVFTWQGWVFGAGNIETTAFLGWSKTAWYMSLPFSGVLMIAYTLTAIWRLLHQPSGQRRR